MCRLLGYCARDHISVADLIGEPGLRDFTALSAAHPDGWGMAALDGGRSHITKSPRRAGDDPGYQRLVRLPLGDLGLVHLRWATPGLPVEAGNSHPFSYGEFSLAHNGAIHPQDRLGELLPSQWQGRLTGTTDSEHYFLHLMSRLESRGGDVVAAVGDTVRRIRRDYTPNCLNAILLAPAALHAISWHDPERIAREAIRARGFQGSEDDLDRYFCLAYRVRADAVVVASTGWPQEGWNLLPNGSVLTVERGTLTPSVRLLDD
jgi:predicted glutamine amidotransferase